MTGRRIECVRSVVTAEQAELRIAELAPGYVVRARFRLYYPYHWFRLRAVKKVVSCLVDARGGAAATSDAFELERRVASRREILDARIGLEHAEQSVKRFADALAVRQQQFRFLGIVYRPYWVLSCAREGEASFSILVDATSGAFCPLPA